MVLLPISFTRQQCRSQVAKVWGWKQSTSSLWENWVVAVGNCPEIMLTLSCINKLCSSSLTPEVQLSPFASSSGWLCSLGHGTSFQLVKKMQATCLLSALSPYGPMLLELCSRNFSITTMHMLPDSGLCTAEIQTAKATVPVLLLIMWPRRKSCRQIIIPRSRMHKRGEKNKLMWELMNMVGDQGKVLG